MSGMAKRRELLEKARIGVAVNGMMGAQALVEVPLLVADVLSEVSGEPVMAYMAIGAEDVAALRAFVEKRQEARS